ncbi:hypothetical protein ISG33_12190 [Glaciecola sp. MH2013]|uniref:hypothetical protein n=1 Tax=Glaciecola sp. MH2013 TaxID=2785524 RepID=UPI0018A11EED|nr:hypothetical protein [Glaciecola sp. MH2013]MBF7074161.1 hypothetical protein [Glaciecola sp. MH2013]
MNNRFIISNLLALLFLGMLISACSDSTEDSTSAPITPALPIPIGSDTPDSNTETSNDIAVYTSVVEGASTKDSDGDGIADNEDPWPTIAPSYADEEELLKPEQFNLVSYRDNGAIALENTVITVEAVNVSMDGLRNSQEPLWLQWQGEGLNWAQRIEAQEQLVITAPELQAQRVTLIQGNQIIASRAIQYYTPDEPLLYPINHRLYVNTNLTLFGENLSKLEGLSLGDEELVISILGDGAMNLSLPDSPKSQMLLTFADGSARQYPLPLYRHVSFVASPDLDASQWRFITRDDLHYLSDEPEIEVPAGEVIPFHFNHLGRSAALSAVVWPDSKVIQVGAESTIERWTYNLLDNIGLKTSDWQLDRRTLPLASDMPDLVKALTNEANNIRIQTSSRSIWEDYLDSGMAWQQAKPLVYTSYSLTTGNALFDQSVSVSNQDAISGRASYNSITVATNDAASVFKESCAGIENITAPSNLWPSDLCIRNSSAVFVSIGARDKNDNIIRNHVREYADGNMLGPSWGGLLNLDKVAFVTTDSGSALCKMEECSIDIITGGLGYLSNSNLSSKERKAYQHVLMRTIVEKVLLEIAAGIVGGGTSNDSPAACLVREMLDTTVKGVKIATSFTELTNKVDSASSEEQVLRIIYETVVSYTSEYLLNLVAESDPKAVACFVSNAAKSAAKEKIAEAAEKVVEKFGVPYKVAQYVNLAIDKWQVATTPQKITFNISPLAQVLKVDTSTNSPLFFDNPNGALIIEGCYITNQRLGNDGLPDPGYDYWPDIIFTDSKGKQTRFTTNSSHLELMSPLCQSRLRIPTDELLPVLTALKSGDIRADLRLTHEPSTFSAFPNDELPLGGASFEWFGEASLNGIDGGFLKQGSRNLIKGQNLAILNNRNLLVQLIRANTNTAIEITNVSFIDEETIAVDIPSNVFGTYELSIGTRFSESNTTLTIPSVSVAPATLSFVRVGDTGAKADDTIVVDVLDANGELVVVNGDFLVIELQGGNSLSTVAFDSATTKIYADDNETLLAATWPIYFEVSCTDGGREKRCTYDFRATIKSPDGTQIFEIKEDGKMSNGDFKTFTL